MLVSNIEPYKLYTTEDLAAILNYHTQSIYQERVQVPQEHDGDNQDHKDNQDKRTYRPRRWLGLVIINWLRVKSGLPPVEPVFTALQAAMPSPAPAAAAEAAESKESSRARAIRLPKRKLKQRVGGAA